jgi:hypothetical protein
MPNPISALDAGLVFRSHPKVGFSAYPASWLVFFLARAVFKVAAFPAI